MFKEMIVEEGAVGHRADDRTGKKGKSFIDE